MSRVGMMTAVYFMALGYAIAKTGADEELRELAGDAYRKFVSTTVRLHRDAVTELTRQQLSSVADDVWEEAAP